MNIKRDIWGKSKNNTLIHDMIRKLLKGTDKHTATAKHEPISNIFRDVKDILFINNKNMLYQTGWHFRVLWE